MNTPVRILGFVAGLAVVFAIAMGVGNAAGPLEEKEPPTHDEAHGSEASEGHGGHEGAEADTAGGSPAELPGGLMVSQGGYTLELAQTQAAPGARKVSFQILGPDGEPVTAYDVEHEKQLHLIAVRRDFSGFQHVHPVLADDGTWTTTLDLTPGTWRLFADFKATAGDPLTLGTDLQVSGDHRPVAPASEVRTAKVDGYTVTLEGDVSAGEASMLTLSVRKDGGPVTDLQPYLGAYGHLVALREGDLAYLHVHPDGEPGDGATRPGPDVVFHTEVPSDGRYRLFLDFKHEGVVRTAAFAVGTDQPGHAHEH